MIIPFSYPWIVRKLIGDCITVLDIGCGDGELMKVLAHPNWEITGIDIYPQSLAKAKGTGVYRQLIKSNVITACKQLVSKKQMYDVVFCSQLIEHLPKKEGLDLIKLMEKLAKKMVYISTPKGYVDQYQQYLEINPYHDHLSGWSTQEFQKMGYHVYGVGLSFVWSENGLARRNNQLLYWLGNSISYLASLPCLILPQVSSGLIAIKKLKPA